MENQFISYLPLPQKRDAGLRIFQQAIKQQNGYNPLASLKSLQHQQQRNKSVIVRLFKLTN